LTQSILALLYHTFSSFITNKKGRLTRKWICLHCTRLWIVRTQNAPGRWYLSYN